MLDEDLLDRDTLERGTLLAGGRYEILHRLGRGGVATVYRARDREIAADVAIKVLSEERANDPEALVRFGNEVSLAANLPAHPNIVRPFEMGRFAELGGRPYMTMEYVRGPTLADLVMVKPLEVVRACRLVLDVTDALVFLHGRGIVHRDVKPSNVIVGREEGGERARLLDFGYAFDIRSFESGSGGRLTQVDHRPGTKHYMAPEQARGVFPAPSFDLYALAVTLYHVLVGNPPFHNRSPREVVLRKVDATRAPFSIKGVCEGLPAELEALVDHGLQREPERRIGSAVEFRERLAAVLAALDPRASDVRAAAGIGRGVQGDPSEPALRLPVATRSPAPVHVDAVVVAPPRPSAHRSAPRGRGGPPWLGLGLAALTTIVVVSIAVALVHPRFRGTNDVAAERDAAPGSDVGASAVDVAPVALASTSDEAPPEPAPEPVAEPEVEPIEPPPTAETKPPVMKEVRPRKPTPAPAVEPSPRPPEVPCEQVRDDAAAAKQAGQWDTLVRLTKRRGCWSDDVARLRLRVYALHRLHRYDQCAAMQDESPDLEVQRTARSCQAALAKENSP